MKEDKINLLKKTAEHFQTDAVLVYGTVWRKENFRYLTRVNFFGPYAIVLYSARSGKTFVFSSTVWDKELSEDRLANINGVFKADADFRNIVSLLKREGVSSVSVSGFNLLPASIASAISGAGINILPGDGFLEIFRYRKTPEEVELLRGAVHMADEAFPVFCRGVSDGLTEFEIVANVEHKLKSMGAEDNFMLIATGGVDVRGMAPPTMKSAEPGHMVRTELTPCNQGWYCQICRTVVRGPANEDQKRSFEIFKEAEEAGLAILKPGVNIGDVARAENAVFHKYGYGEFTKPIYTRVRGHGQGLYLDEAPIVNEDVDLIVEEGMVMVVHPNTYNPLSGYMVFGDPVVVTKDGYDILTQTERKLFEA